MGRRALPLRLYLSWTSSSTLAGGMRYFKIIARDASLGIYCHSFCHMPGKFIAQITSRDLILYRCTLITIHCFGPRGTVNALLQTVSWCNLGCNNLWSRDIDGLLPNKSVTVQNSCRLKSPDGDANVIRGYAYRPDDSEQGKLKVDLNGVPGVGDCKLMRPIMCWQ